LSGIGPAISVLALGDASRGAYLAIVTAVSVLEGPVALTPPSDGSFLCPVASPPVGEESHKERVDRELIELLNELRVALPGVQVLFAFLLGIPFANRFKEVSGTTEIFYIVCLVSTAAASAFLIAPSALHRLRFRDPDKEEILLLSNRLSIVGMGLLAVSIGAAVYVVVSFLYGPWPGGLLTGLVGALIAGLWYVLPLVSRD
jgi:hypothetical protein